MSIKLKEILIIVIFFFQKILFYISKGLLPKDFLSLKPIVKVSIGKVEFFEPEILMLPDKVFFPSINNFCIEIKSLEALHLFVSYIYPFFYRK